MSASKQYSNTVQVLDIAKRGKTTMQQNPNETVQLCSLCMSHHPAYEGITHFENIYECNCGNTWTDQWCCACDDECSVCRSDVSPTESDIIEVVEEPAERTESVVSL